MCDTRKQKKVKEQEGNREISVVSYFAGCGGLDLGLIGDFTYRDIYFNKHPFKIIAAYDSDKKCVETYNFNIGQHSSMLDLSVADPQTIPAAEILIGGFPCQEFSSCGPLGGLESERGKLYLAMVRYMETHKPKLVIAENVPNLAKMDNGNVLEKIKTDFQSVGYKFSVWTLSAKEFGVPQGRVRLIFIGVRDDIEKVAGMPEEPKPTNIIHPIEWAIGDLINVKDDSVHNQGEYFKANKAKKGNGQGDEISREGEPSYTIRANAKSRVQFHYSLDRRLTIRECARIQTFPDSFIFRHSMTTNIMQIGNAVPPMLAHAVGNAIIKYLELPKTKEAFDK